MRYMMIALAFAGVSSPAVAQLALPPQMEARPAMDAAVATATGAMMQQQQQMQQQMPAGMQQVDGSGMAAPAPTPLGMAQQPEPMMAPAAQSAPALCGNLPPMLISISHGITFVSGGTNQAEIEQFKALDGEFNLQMLLSAKNGDHLVVQSARILDYKGFELVKAVGAGPYFYAYIRPGDYKLEVTLEPGAKPITVALKVPSRGRMRKTILLK